MKTQTSETLPSFKTAEFYFICFLIAKECGISNIERSATRTFFYFEDLEKCEALQQDFLNGTALVSARKYADAIRNTKAMIRTGSKD